MAENVADFLGPAIPLPRPRKSLSFKSFFSIGSSDGSGDAFALDMTGQEETNWCWSAVAQAIVAHSGSFRPAQEEIATAHVANSRPGATCAPPNRRRSGGGGCTSPRHCSAECNGDHDVSVVLAERGFASAVLSRGEPIDFDDIAPEISRRHPIVCRMSFDGKGHFVCVSGWWVAPNGSRHVLVYDPWSRGPRRPVEGEYIPYEEFVARYRVGTARGRNNHSWTVRTGS